MEQENEIKETVEPSIPPLDMNKVMNDENIMADLLRYMAEVKLLSDQGFRAQGNGIIIRKLEALWKKVDQVSLRTYQIEKKLDQLLAYRR